MVVDHGTAGTGEREILQLAQRVLETHATGTDTFEEPWRVEAFMVLSCQS